MTKSLRVLQLICPTGFYGAERWILALAKNLDAGFCCDLAVTVEPGMDKLQLVEAYRKLGRPVHEVQMSGRFDFGVVYKLKKLIKENGYDIIHTHGYKSDILGLLAGKLAGIRTLATPHGFENANDWKLRTYIGIGNWFMTRFDCVAPLSEELCSDVKNFGVKPHRVKYIKNGVDLDEVEARRLSIETNPVVAEKKGIRVGFIGQMISRKNVADLLDVFDLLAKKYSDAELVLLGDGEQRAELEAYANTLESSARISFKGFRNDRLDWLQSFDLFAMTSTLGGIPRCLMESMAMGVPVAAYNIPGIDQLLSHNDTGLLAEPRDKKALLKYWEELLFNEKLSRKVADSARQFVIDEFSGKRMARDYSELYDELTNSRC